MRPYLAVIKDSFREAFASWVLWIVLILILLFLLVIAPFGYRAVPQVRLLERDVPPPQDLGLILELVDAHGTDDTPAGHISGMLTSNLNDRMRAITEFDGGEGPLTEEEAVEIISAYRGTVDSLREELNTLLYSRDFYDQAALEKPLVGQHADGDCSVPLVLAGQRDRVQVGAEQPLARRCPLDLGDERDARGAQGRHKVPWRRRQGHLCLDGLDRPGLFAVCHFVSLPIDDLVQDGCRVH